MFIGIITTITIISTVLILRNIYGDHTNPPHPHKSDLNQFNKLEVQWTSSLLRVFDKFLHLINPNLDLLNRGGGGGVGLCGPKYKSIMLYYIIL